MFQEQKQDKPQKQQSIFKNIVLILLVLVLFSPLIAFAIPFLTFYGVYSRHCDFKERKLGIAPVKEKGLLTKLKGVNSWKQAV